ncbi:hypothetical protein NMG60_11011983 [Bertholletia excelsa]
MTSSTDTLNDEFFSSLVSDIKTYTGKDPLLPWLRGFRKMKECLPPLLLKAKLPRFLQKCAQTFENDRRYTNDLRYLRVWLQLMDFVDNPRAVLKTMEAKRIGMKKSLFYQAYALYYEKVKKFEEADKMYHLGVQNLAEPIDELQKSYEQFLGRMERHKKKTIQRQERMIERGLLNAGGQPSKRNVGTKPEGTVLEVQPSCGIVENKVVLEESFPNKMTLMEPKPTKVADNICNVDVSRESYPKEEVMADIGCERQLNEQNNSEVESEDPNKFCGDDTVVVRFVDNAFIGKSDAENACHNGLVEPTINTKNVLNAINSMFREPLEPAIVRRRSTRSQPKADQKLDKGFEVFVDENLDEDGFSNPTGYKGFMMLPDNRFETSKCLEEPLQVYIDDEENNEEEERIKVKNDLKKHRAKQLTGEQNVSDSHVNFFVFPSPKDLTSECSIGMDGERSPKARIREDTVVCRFVGATISDEPQVENVCHHGLVEPTINLKEAMDDINSMFGKPIDFVRANRHKKKGKASYNENNCAGFVILPDDNLNCERGNSQPISTPRNESELFEPTVCTKEAMDDINKMFGMPLDF